VDNADTMTKGNWNMKWPVEWREVGRIYQQWNTVYSKNFFLFFQSFPKILRFFN